MNSNSTLQPNAVATLRRLARPQPAAEHCEFCSLGLAPSHRHLLEVATRKLVCACDPCALLFDRTAGRFKLVPRDTRRLVDFQITDVQWEGLSLPIQLAFCFKSTPADRVIAMYPSPAGATESLLPLASWQALVEENPALEKILPDVECLLVNRLHEAREYYLAPIDVGFELAGLIRVHWRGFSGGDEVWRELDGFFARLQQTSRTVREMRPEARHA